jgi:FKBP-type peptidyl-prolyl cis-trans isomerase
MWVLVSAAAAAWTACDGDDDADRATTPAAQAAPRGVPQIKPPLDVQKPPDDATRTASGLVYKTLVGAAGARPLADDAVLIRYTGWRQRSGETFFTTEARGQPIEIDVAHAAPAFREALSLLHKGETAMLWMPSGSGGQEDVAYEVEVVDIVAKPGSAGRGPARQ